MPEWVIRLIWSTIFGTLSGSISALLMIGVMTYAMRKYKFSERIAKLEKVASEIESFNKRLDKIEIKQMK